jgi:transposase, IS30 family
MRKGSYRHLNEHDRVKIEVYLREGKSRYEIAKLLQVNPSTISREVNKRGGIFRGYTAGYAQKDYEAGKRRCGVKRKIENHPVGSFVIDRLKAGWSPEAISGRLKREIDRGIRSKDDHICHESIYQFVYESQYGRQEHLSQYLRQGKRRRTKRHGRKSKHQIIPNRISIDNRPLEVNTRRTIGHWEGDTIMYGRKRGINSLVERKTRYVVLTKIASKTPEETEAVITRRLKNQQVKSITFDNGIENRNHENMANALRANIYFCHPYHSWEKGTNENTNGLVRRFLPKRTDIATVFQRDIDDVAWELNNRPRKVLGYATPTEMLELEYQKLSIVALNP